MPGVLIASANSVCYADAGDGPRKADVVDSEWSQERWPGDWRGREDELGKLGCSDTNIPSSNYKATKVIAEFCSNYGNTITLL